MNSSPVRYDVGEHTTDSLIRATAFEGKMQVYVWGRTWCPLNASRRHLRRHQRASKFQPLLLVQSADMDTPRDGEEFTAH